MTKKETESVFNAELLRKNADAICEAVQENSIVYLFKCDTCERPHMRIVPEGGEVPNWLLPAAA